MENIDCFIIIMIILLVIIYQINYSQNSSKSNSEPFDLLDMTPLERCETLSKKKFMIRDINTRLWLSTELSNGYGKFLPGGFGIPFMLSENPTEYLPLRLLADPNDYMLATYDKKGIRVVSNPYTEYFKLEIYIYNQSNIIGWLDESDTQYYLYIDPNGNITSVTNPSDASSVEMLIL